MSTPPGHTGLAWRPRLLGGLLAFDAFGLLLLIADGELGTGWNQMAAALGFAVAAPVLLALLWRRLSADPARPLGSLEEYGWWVALGLSGLAVLALALEASPLVAAGLALGIAAGAWLARGVMLSPIREAVPPSPLPADRPDVRAQVVPRREVAISPNEAPPEATDADDRLEEARRRWQQRAAEGVDSGAGED
jgi:hypothetical protein